MAPRVRRPSSFPTARCGPSLHAGRYPGRGAFGEPLHLADTGTQILLANTYHLSQRPGKLVAKAGGLHGFMGVDL